MKNTSFLFPWLLLFLIISLYAWAKANAASTLPVVRDLDKKPILTGGVRYYMLPVIRGQGGGVSVTTASGKKTCPLDQIIQDPLEVNRGIPVTFSPLNITAGVVRESTDLNIRFSGARKCDHSTFWRLGKYDESNKKYFLTTGGIEGNPGIETISSWFKIEKFGDNYKLFYCPTVCNYCKIICKDVGIYVENGKRRLALTDDQPFSIMFKKA